MSFEQKRIRELESQLADATVERDILKKAVRIFSKND
jgi:transposase-like protein